jgi:hypothetical protein
VVTTITVVIVAACLILLAAVALLRKKYRSRERQGRDQEDHTLVMSPMEESDMNGHTWRAREEEEDDL